jgi:hypothetical protein
MSTDGTRVAKRLAGGGDGLTTTGIAKIAKISKIAKIPDSGDLATLLSTSWPQTRLSR